MNRIFLLITFCIFATAYGYANDRDSIYVLGWPKDALTNEPVIDDTKVELMTTDSIVIATAEPKWNTQYRAGSYFI